ncbi:MAG: 7TM-DISM domain-containing protein [Ketobacteraceae bacterium]|nr:7TM-DISM domain-containing protein [Ketobacteraceae bacterium]
MQLQLKVNTNQLFLRVVFPVAIVGLLVAVVMLINALFQQQPVRAETGVLDLRTWAFEENPALLAGEWAFYWNRYLPPEDISDQALKQAPGYLSLPGVWNGMDYRNKPLPHTGHATLALEILVPEGHTYLLKVPILTNRYRLWVNQDQKVYDDLEQPWAKHTEATHSRIFQVQPQQGVIQVVFHLLNDRHRAGGIWEPLTFTRHPYRDDLVKWPKVFDAVSAFVLSCSALLILGRAYREQRWSYFFLALFAAFMSVRCGTVNERLFFELLTIRSWELQQALEHISLYGAFMFFALYSGYRFPSYFPAPLHWLVVSVNSVLIALVLLTPPSVFAHTIVLFQIVGGLYLFLWLGALLEHVRESRSAKILFAGGLFSMLCAVNDILYALNFIDSTNLMHLGALGFVVASYFFRGEMIKQGSLLEAVAFTQRQDVPEDDPHPLASHYAQFNQQGDDHALRELTVHALHHALTCWETATGDDKISFAQASGLWRVTNDNGTLKTRTFDKYLKMETLPQNPRYKTVGKTMEYVARADGIHSEDRAWLLRIAGIYESL